MRTPWIVSWLALLPFLLFGQDDKGPVDVSVSGTASLQMGIYGYNSTDSTFRPRRPPFNYQLVVNPTIQFNEKVSLPITLILNKRQQDVLFPLPEAQNPLEYATNPNNSIGLSPQFGNIQLHLGTHTVQFSDLTLGNIPIFGFGFDLKPKGLQLAASYGFANWGIETDSLNNITGAYQRRIYAIRGRLGNEEKSFVAFNFANMDDDPSSVENPLIGIPAEEGMLGSGELRIAFGEHVSLEGEGAISLFSSDIDAEEYQAGQGFPQLAEYGLYTLRYSTLLDYAISSSLNFNFEKAGLKLAFKNISPGFRTFGYPFLRTDMRDITASPYLNLADNKVRFSGTFGYRTDNVKDTKIGPSNNMLLAGNIFAQLSQRISLNANYSNFGLRNNIDNDTLKVESVSKNLSLSPTFTLQSGNVNSTLTLVLARSTFEDYNFLTEVQNQNNTTSLTAVYTWLYQQFSVALNGSFINNKRAADALKIKTGGLRLGYNIPEKKIRLATFFAYTHTTVMGFTPDKQFKIQPSVRWSFTPKLSWQLSYSWRRYRYGSLRDDHLFTENFLQTSLNQRF